MKRSCLRDSRDPVYEEILSATLQRSCLLNSADPVYEEILSAKSVCRSPPSNFHSFTHLTSEYIVLVINLLTHSIAHTDCTPPLMTSLPGCLSTCLSTCLPTCLSVCLSVCLSFFLSPRLYLSVCLSLSLT